MPGLTANPCFAHLHALLAPAGVVQFCQGSVPDESSGTCLDDNARAWLVAMYALHGDPDQPYARAIGDTTANFVAAAQLASGRFHNLADITGRFTDDIGSEDSFGRALWACGVGARCAPVERRSPSSCARSSGQAKSSGPDHCSRAAAESIQPTSSSQSAAANGRSTSSGRSSGAVALTYGWMDTQGTPRRTRPFSITYAQTRPGR